MITPVVPIRVGDKEKFRSYHTNWLAWAEFFIVTRMLLYRHSAIKNTAV